MNRRYEALTRSTAQVPFILYIDLAHHVNSNIRSHTMLDINPNLPITLDEIPESEQQALLEKVATQIVKRRLTVPAIIALEVFKPLNFLGSQALIAFNPFVQSIFNAADYQKFALIIEKDVNVEFLIKRIEDLDKEEK